MVELFPELCTVKKSMVQKVKSSVTGVSAAAHSFSGGCHNWPGATPTEDDDVAHRFTAPPQNLVDSLAGKGAIGCGGHCGLQCWGAAGLCGSDGVAAIAV